ncbi:MAG: hypothetical protein ABEJ68_00405 [Halobacteriaceae archaeon]
MSEDGDPGTLRWGDDEPAEEPDADDDSDRDAELCRVSDPTCEACQ